MHSHAAPSTCPAAERFRSALFALREEADIRIFWLLIAQWAVTLVTSFMMASQWRQGRATTLSAAVIGVGLLSILPLAIVLRLPGSWQTRWTVAISQGLMSPLLWYVAGGRPDMHLHLFAWLVVLALYRDISVLLATLTTALIGHALMIGSGILPLSIDDSAQWLTYLVWLVGETAFLSAFVVLDRQALVAQTERDHALELLQGEFQGRVDSVSRKLIEERDYLKGELASLTERSADLQSARFETARDLLSLRREVASHGTAILKLANRPADSSLTSVWRSQWQALRQQAQHLMRLVDLPSLQAEGSPEMPSPFEPNRDKHPAGRQLETEKRAMLMMRNPLQQAKAIAALETLGFKVDVVANGPRTYYSVMLNDYSVIVVDIDLPEDEGYDTLEALRMLPPDEVGRQRCLFAMTTETTPDRVLRCTELGVDGIFPKPLQADMLRQSLSERAVIRPAREGNKPGRSGSNAAFRHST